MSIEHVVYHNAKKNMALTTCETCASSEDVPGKTLVRIVADRPLAEDEMDRAELSAVLHDQLSTPDYDHHIRVIFHHKTV